MSRHDVAAACGALGLRGLRLGSRRDEVPMQLGPRQFLGDGE
jgi:hypothetical protein